jgi:hypothetical protein
VQAAELRLDLAGLREAPELVLGKDERAVHLDVEDAAAAADQLGRDAEFTLEIGCQPGSPRLVVSSAAEFDGNAHGALRSPPGNTRIP